VSHQSAAVLHGLPLWNVGLDRVHITRRPRAWNDTSPVLRCHVARLRDGEVMDVDGFQVTDPVRTALDLARSLPHEAAVVALDGALHVGALSHDDLRARLMDIAGSPGSRSASRVVAAADGRSQSVGESRSRLACTGGSRRRRRCSSRSGRVRGCSWRGRTSPGRRTGSSASSTAGSPGQDPGDAVFEEKLREDAIRDESWNVVRWVWADL
jgi:hypothetical protein